MSAAEAQLDPGTVRFQPDIEPLVRLLEDTPREHLLEEVAVRIRDGLSYREVLAALLLAGVRNVQPRPAVGFKFHAVLVVNSAHLASLSSPDADRWLPIFWALDYFKSSQAQDEREGNWTMPPVDEAAVPAADKADVAFRQAMDQWDESAADAAIAGLCDRRRGSIVRSVRARRCSRFSQHWSQGHLRLQRLSHAAVHRLALFGTGTAIARLCAAESRRSTESRRERSGK